MAERHSKKKYKLCHRVDSTAADDGFILVIVLVVLATLAASISGILLISRQTTTLSSILEKGVRGRLTTSTGIRRVIASIEDDTDDMEIAILTAESGYAWTFDDHNIRLFIEGEGGKINPATTEMIIITRYLNQLNLPQEDRVAINALISNGRRNGNSTVTPSDLHPYLLTDISLNQVERDFTTLHQAIGIDPIYASPAVLSAIPDLSQSEVDTILQMSRVNRSEIVGLSTHFVSSPPMFTIVAVTNIRLNRKYTMRVPVEITRSGQVRTLNGFR